MDLDRVCLRVVWLHKLGSVVPSRGSPFIPHKWVKSGCLLTGLNSPFPLDPTRGKPMNVILSAATSSRTACGHKIGIGKCDGLHPIFLVEYCETAELVESSVVFVLLLATEHNSSSTKNSIFVKPHESSRRMCVLDTPH